MISSVILTDRLKSIDDQYVYNFLSDSPSSRFYDELFSGNFNAEKKPELFEEVKKQHKAGGQAYRVMEEIVSFLEKKLPAEAVVVEIGGGVHQQRSANANQRFKHYFPLDISASSIRRYADKYKQPGILADATELPFKDGSIDCIFTHTFLEHPLQPEKVVAEIVRVLKPGGFVVHNDAWFCRWWHRFGIVGLKRFANMTLREKCIVMAARFTEFKVLRIPPIILRRVLHHLLYSGKKNVPLVYRKLKPNYNLHLGCDEDAASAIDPIAVVMFYESRNFTLNSNLSFWQRLRFPNRYIVLRKGK